MAVDDCGKNEARSTRARLQRGLIQPRHSEVEVLVIFTHDDLGSAHLVDFEDADSRAFGSGRPQPAPSFQSQGRDQRTSDAHEKSDPSRLVGEGKPGEHFWVSGSAGRKVNRVSIGQVYSGIDGRDTRLWRQRHGTRLIDRHGCHSCGLKQSFLEHTRLCHVVWSRTGKRGSSGTSSPPPESEGEPTES